MSFVAVTKVGAIMSKVYQSSRRLTLGGQKYTTNATKKVILAMMAPNGWISMDLDWIWAGYIQDGLFFLENIYWTNSQAQVN